MVALKSTYQETCSKDATVGEMDKGPTTALALFPLDRADFDVVDELDRRHSR